MYALNPAKSPICPKCGGRCVVPIVKTDGRRLEAPCPACGGKGIQAMRTK